MQNAPRSQEQLNSFKLLKHKHNESIHLTTQTQIKPKKMIIKLTNHHNNI
jgi:hypothetical protein